MVISMTEAFVVNQSGESLDSTFVGGDFTINLGGRKVVSHLEESGAAAEVLADFKELMSGLERLRALEISVRTKVEMIKGRWWDVSDETGVAGELHGAITELLIELESESKARQEAEASALA